MKAETRWLAYLPLLLFVLAAIDRIWITEDAFITFRVVENLWNGDGPVFNPGIRVEAYTHPLWLAILVVLRVFGPGNLPLLAALTGIVFSTLGFLLSIRASNLFWDKTSVWPGASIVIAATPVFWDFASSGLEGGLATLWLGGAAYGLATVRGRAVWPLAWWLSLGPVIRPEFSIFWLCFIVALLALRRDKGNTAELAGVCAVAALIPLAHQVFRMGYFAAVVSNTAIAKEGFSAHWSQGLLYLWDTVGVYYLWLPISIIAWVCLRGEPRTVDRKHLIVGAAFVVGGLLHLVGITRLGGDFMHGRMLLPGLFALATPLMVIPRHKLLFGLYVWGVAPALFLGPSYGWQIGDDGIADERLWYVHRARCNRPIDLDDYRHHNYYRVGEKVGLMMQEQSFEAIYWAHIGIAPAVLPEQLIVIDPLGLNDYITSRIELGQRARPGL